MQEAVPAGLGGMAAVMGLTAETIEQVLNDIPGVQIANYNCPGQIVISGEKKAVDTASAALKDAGAKRVVSLNVSGPFHSEMLREAGGRLGQVLETVEVCGHEIPYVTNVTASYVTGTDEIKRPADSSGQQLRALAAERGSDDCGRCYTFCGDRSGTDTRIVCEEDLQRRGRLQCGKMGTA